MTYFLSEISCLAKLWLSNRSGIHCCSYMFLRQPCIIWEFYTRIFHVFVLKPYLRLVGTMNFNESHVIRRIRRRNSACSTGIVGSRCQGRGYSTGVVLPLNKRIGQHILKNPGILDKIVQAANIKASDTVLEIGPGTGNLTVRLLDVARKVVAIDVDSRMINEVRKRAFALGYTNLEVQEGDALRVNLGKFDVCTANLPYQISSPFLFRLLAHRPIFRCAVLMFQKEFAERLLAEPNDDKYGRLAINTKLFCKVTRVCKVSAGSFTPPPQVDSMIVRLTPLDPPLNVDFREWDGLMRICFGRKRKTLHAVFKRQSCLSMLENNYKTWCSLNHQKPEPVPFRELCLGVLDECELSFRRSITVDIDTFFQLLLAFNRKGIHFVNVAQAPITTDDKFTGIDEFFFCDENVIDSEED